MNSVSGLQPQSQSLSLSRPRPRRIRLLHRCLILSAALLFSFPIFAGAIDAEPEPTSGVSIPGPGFGPGEKLKFSIHYGFMKAGTAWLKVTEPDSSGDGDLLEFSSRAESSDFFSLFFRVRDEAFSLVTADSLCSVRFTKNLLEGDFSRRETILFDQAASTALYPDGEVKEIPPCARDPLAALFYIRTLQLEVGSEVEVPNHVDGKNYPVVVKVRGRETIEVPAGRFDCFVVEPVLKSAGIFRHKGKMKIWLTADEYRMPVLMKTKVMIGSVEAGLTSFTKSRER